MQRRKVSKLGGGNETWDGFSEGWARLHMTGGEKKSGKLRKLSYLSPCLRGQNGEI